ncbi:MAG: hypothetical protein UT34_C0002G0019 [candidate division WS6 bacterium GW2011_GWF2_39_15]|uniref:Uncharacterized protein n=1 Tax=candidate division WS6 bacterium GW2011_GWF2_39_15 TaxID=1619100 RepID=A0A0G0QV36_9BACT|nr:MAG: hypothetical protein UT34_C0002G0019 [candidate division WS6 bacterium GW2011_GWF2_39_15]
MGDTKQFDVAKIREGFNSDKVADLAVKLAESPEVLNDFNTTLFANMVFGLFYRETYGFSSGVFQNRVWNLKSGEYAINEILGSTMFYFNQMPNYFDATVEKVHKRNLTTMAFNFPQLTFVDRYKNQIVLDTAEEIHGRITEQPESINQLLLVLANILSDFVDSGKKDNSTGYMGVHDVLPKTISHDDQVRLIHLALSLGLTAKP